MFGRFLPKETSFFDYFEQHAAFVVLATQEFQKIVSSEMFSKKKETLQFKEWEHEADLIVHECVEALHKTFITPIDREDILRLISEMDDIMDSVDAAVDCLAIYRIEKPTPEQQKFAEILSKAAEKVALIVKGLRNMKNASDIRENGHDIRRLENEADSTLRYAIGKLFDQEMDTRTLIKFKEIYEILENGIDSCHRVANIIEGILLECD